MLLLFVGFALGSDWSGNYSPRAQAVGDKVQYKYVAEFDTSATLTSKVKEIRQKDYDENWTNNPFTCFYRMTAADSITATVATVLFYGVVDNVAFVVDTLSLDFGTSSDSSAYTTLDFNNRKFPEYKATVQSDSCTFTWIIF